MEQKQETKMRDIFSLWTSKNSPHDDSWHIFTCFAVFEKDTILHVSIASVSSSFMLVTMTAAEARRYRIIKPTSYWNNNIFADKLYEFVYTITEVYQPSGYNDFTDWFCFPPCCVFHFLFPLSLISWLFLAAFSSSLVSSSLVTSSVYMLSVVPCPFVKSSAYLCVLLGI